MNHYRRLGVARGASGEEIHAAYRARARLLHPDRDQGDERAMQELNEAWSVLRDPARRRAYDESLWPRAQARPTFEDPPHDGEVFVAGDDHGPLVRHLPWAVVLAVLAAIFVFTALARSPGDDVEREADITAGECVVAQPGVGVTETSCTDPSSRQVVSVPRGGGACPTGTERFDTPSLASPLCLDR